MTSPAPPPQTSAPALGWLLVVPAVLGTLITLVLPTAQTIWLSLHSGGVLRESTYVGTANYTELLGDDTFWRALGFTVSLIVIPLLVAVVVAPLLALALDRAGTWPRRAGRIALSLAIVTFSPVGVAAAWLRGLVPDAPGLLSLVEGLREPATAPGTLRLVVAVATFGIVCSLAVTAFLPALRAGTPAAPGLQPSGASSPDPFQPAPFPGPAHPGPAHAGPMHPGPLQSGAVHLGPQQSAALHPGPQRSGGLHPGALQDRQYVPSDVVPAGAASRGRGAAGAMIVVGILVALSVVAVGLQAFSIGLVLTRGGPQRVTETLAGLQYDYAFRAAQFGPGASVAAFTGVILGVLGIVATIVAVASRMRVTVTPRAARDALQTTGAAGDARDRSPRAAGVALGVTALVVFVAAALVCAWPWIDGVLASLAAEGGDLRTQVNTWVPAAAGALVSVGVAYLAALGIGGLRPLGRHSEWLLLLFAPWLFVSTGPLGVANWQNMRNLGLIDTFAALLPPVLVSVPALLVLTLLCKGLTERAGRDFFGGVFLPSLPMAGILAGAVALMNAQDLLWPMLVAQKPALFTAPVAQMAQIGGFGASTPAVGAATPLVVVAVALVAAVAAHLLYLDRLVITTKGSQARTPAA
ncbi:hypothetical protein [Nonomuraea sp. NPDC002799]